MLNVILRNTNFINMTRLLILGGVSYENCNE